MQYKSNIHNSENRGINDLQHEAMHLDRWLLQPRYKVCGISYLRVSYHSSQLLLTFWYINHKKIKRKEFIDVTYSGSLQCNSLLNELVDTCICVRVVDYYILINSWIQDNIIFFFVLFHLIQCIIKKKQISNLVYATRLWNNLHHVHSKTQSTDRKAKSLRERKQKARKWWPKSANNTKIYMLEWN